MSDKEIIFWISCLVFLGMIAAFAIENTFYTDPAQAEALSCKLELGNQTKVCNDMKLILGGMMADCTMQNPCICGAEAVNGSFRVGCQKMNYGPQKLSDTQYRINETH